jgi:D-xylonolactonase
MEPELIADEACNTGEGPLWHPEEAALYWVDIPDGELYRYDPAAGDHELVHDGRPIGGFTIETDGDLALFRDSGRVERWNRSEGVGEVLLESIEEEADSRFNDVFADPAGRVFAGTMPTDNREGRLYCIDPDGTLTHLFEDVKTPNGMGLSPDGETLYFAETNAYVVHAFEYDEPTGAIRNRRDFIDFESRPGKPDGLTVDAAGHLWVAKWNGGRVERFDADGAFLEDYEFPARKVSSIAFGGPDYRDAYVTTAGGDDKDGEGEGAGALFRLPDVGEGQEEHRSALGT